MYLRSYILTPALLSIVSALAATAPQPPTLRLNHDVQPGHIWLDLTLSPEKTDFSGKVRMDLQINNAVDHFWLNAADLSITEAKLEQNGQTLTAQIVPGGTDFVGFQFPSTLTAGKARFSLSYTGKVNLKSSGGIFLSKQGQDRYLFTQFEPIDARRAFPCFDEPGYKIPWQVTLHVPEAAVAVSNTKIENETNETDGMKAVRFTETKPLPSYLIAFGVGPLEFVDAGTAGSRHVPVRIVVPRGDKDRAKYAASVSAEILTRLEDYFGIPYPYDKSDQLAIPLSFGGAMENPGLVTYDANIILSPPGEDSVRHQRGYASVAAHELAHQWTGDMVTMKWWNDVWLNESFATWMSAKLIAEWKPEWQTRAQNEGARLMAINVDTRTSARRINQPVESKSDIGNAFDGITYQKGGSVLAMFENAVGPKNFQRVMHDYLTAHMFGNATAEDFLAELGRHTKPEYATAFATFLNQTGVPELKAHLDCAAGSKATLQVEQQRLLPLGSSGDVSRTWNVPFCVSYSEGQGRKEMCSLLTGQNASVTLPGKACPAWFLGNDKEIGYYEVAYDADALKNLLTHRDDLSLAEEVGVLGDLDVLAHDSQVSWDQVLGLVSQLKDDVRPEITLAEIRLATVPSHYIEPGLRANYANYVEEMFGERARQLGWLPKPTDTPEQKLLRPALVGFVAMRGKDPQLIEEAKRLANEWLGDHKTAPADVAGSILDAAARNSDSIFYDKVLAAAKAEHDPYFTPILIGALGDFQDPQLVQRSLALAFDGTFDMRMSMRMFSSSSDDPKVAELPYQYVKEHYDEVVAKLPSSINTDYAARLPGLASGVGCSEDAAAEAKAFFEPRMAKVVGGPRSLANALEQIHLCAAAKPEATEQIAKFLSNYPAKSAGA
ncbi:MAG: M1 family metallopeptidase, partial [Bryobacteraceae bacterium]